MKKSFFQKSVFTPFVALLNLLVFKQRVIGLTSDSIKKSKPKVVSSQSLPTNTVDVWNNVVDVQHLAPLLHEESRRIGLGHKVFSRPSATVTSNISTNIIERTLDSILTELGDDSKYVEYWTRLEWRSIQAHADVDEYRAKQENQSQETRNNDFRYPRNGHVLYLQVGSQVRGPTCVFPNRRSGGDLLRKIEVGMLCGESEDTFIDENTSFEHVESSVDNNEDNSVELVTVPAVPGRLLRFKGDYLHAVPRPTDLWLLKFVKGSPIFEPEEDWGRSVILFNTWDHEPPLGLPLDEINDEDKHDLHHGCNKIHQWSPATPLSSSSPSLVSCVGSEEGGNQCEHEYDTIPAKIWLLGDNRRRDYERQTVNLEAGDSLCEALYQESTVMSTKLRIPR